MRHRAAVTVALFVTSLLVSGCALQSWIRGLLEKPEAALDERLVGVARTVAQHTGQISGLESRVAGAAALAREARDRADVAVARTDAIDRRQAPPARATREPARPPRALFGMVHVRFALDRADLDDKAEKALLTVIKELRQHPGLTLDLEGTTDSRGTRDYNVQLSRRRVDAVRRYLVTRGVEAQRIVHASGVGPLREEGIAEEDKRRVTVKLMTPS
jgi:outer membrane protein OmpA-like peptidoglycan-associated protein